MPVRAGRDNVAPSTQHGSVPEESGASYQGPHGMLAHPSSHNAQGARGDRAAKGGLTLLVIEDSLAGTRSVQDMLDAAGGYLPDGPVPAVAGGRVRVRTARNLTEAERLLTDDVQCILLDLALTGGAPLPPSASLPSSAPLSPGAPPASDSPFASGAGETAATPGLGESWEPGDPGGNLGNPGNPGDPGNPVDPREREELAEPLESAGRPEPEAADRSAEAQREDEERAPGSGGHAGAGQPLEPDGPERQTGYPGELEMLRRVLRMAPRHAVLALTDGADAERAAAAVSVGAQDYLFRDELDGRLLTRAIRYAVERKRADLAQQKLAESRLRAQENARLERGLLPRPLLAGSELRFASRYRPGRSRALLGGDFHDTVRTSDGTVHVMIGDVCGHGPDEAALGVALRIAWRALTFAGLCGDHLLGTLQKVLEHERASEEVFATLCTVDISPDGRSAGVYLAGHPSPLVASVGVAPRLLPGDESGPALGILKSARWPRREVELGGSWSLLLYTDGMIEGRVGEGRGRLGQEGMVDLVAARMAQGEQGESLLDATMGDIRQLNGGELTDDVAVLLLDRG